MLAARCKECTIINQTFKKLTSKKENNLSLLSVISGSLPQTLTSVCLCLLVTRAVIMTRFFDFRAQQARASKGVSIRALYLLGCLFGFGHRHAAIRVCGLTGTLF